MSDNNAQVSSQVILYVLSSIIFAGIFIYGYSAIQGISKVQEDVSYIKFEEDIKAVVRELLANYGDVEIFNERNPLMVSGDYSQLCIIDLNKGPPVSPDEPHPLIRDSWKSGVQMNVFLLKGNQLKDSFYVGNITVVRTDSDYQCFDIRNGRIVGVRLEGIGRKAALGADCKSFQATSSDPYPDIICCRNVACDGYYLFRPASGGTVGAACYKDYLHKQGPAPYYIIIDALGSKSVIQCCMTQTGAELAGTPCNLKAEDS